MHQSEMSLSMTEGVDVSHYNHLIDFDYLKSRNYGFVILKATEGIDYVDAKFARRWRTLKNLNMIRGAYHFFHPSKDPFAQAKLFCETVGPLDSLDFLALDWETTDGIPRYQDVSNGLFFLQQLEVLSNKIPIIYTTPYFGDALILPQNFNKYPLWVAHYGVSRPMIPGPWVKFDFWQYSQTGHIPSMSPVDLNVFNGDYNALVARIESLNKVSAV
jgi:lysozyme